MSGRSWIRSGRAVGVAGGLLLVLFAACSDDVTVGEVTPDAGGPDASPVDDAAVDDAGAIRDAADDRDAGAEARCGLDGFCLIEGPSSKSPAGQPVTLNDVWLDPDGRAWAVGFRAGVGALVTVFDGKEWTDVWTGPANLSSIWGVGRQEIWAAGQDLALHGVAANGTWEWTAVPLPANSRVHKIWAQGPNEAWACGFSGVLHWTGSEWVRSFAARAVGVDKWDCGTVWGTETGEVWATISHGVYDYADEYYRTTMYLARRPPGGAPDVGDAGDADAGEAGDAGALDDDELDPASTDGWRIVAGTRLSQELGTYGQGAYAGGGVHRIVGSLGSRIGAMHSKLEAGRVVFGPFAEALDGAGKSLPGVGLYDLWAGPNEAWALGQLGVYRYDGASWSYAKTAIDGMPLIALGRPNGIFADSKQVIVVGNNIVLRREEKVKP